MGGSIMEIARVWVISKQWEEVYDFSEEFVEEFANANGIEIEDDIEVFASDYREEIFDWLDKNKTNNDLLGMWEEFEREEILDGEVVEYRFDKEG